MHPRALPVGLLALLSLCSPTPAPAQDSQLTGTLHLVWGDPRNPGGPGLLRYYLVDDDGAMRELALDERLLRAAGGPLAVDRRRVTVALDRAAVRSGLGTPGARLPVRSVLAAAPVAAPAQLGPRRFVTILCKFGDSPTVEIPRSRYQAWMGGAYGGLDHFWREASADRINLAGTDVVGWYSLPKPRAEYIVTGPDGNPSANLNALFNDCTALADPVIDFTRYFGINLQFNQELDGASWGGSRRADLDGAPGRVYGTTWMADWATMFVYAHEIGHSLGLPHSSGPYGQVYDSRWDVMSNGYFQDPEVDTRVPVHTIGWHRSELLGWVPEAQVYLAPPTSRVTIDLQRLSSLNGPGYQVAVVPLADDHFYTVESRRFTGYDRRLPAEGVVIHRVDPFTGNSPARVVDPDGDGDPNDDGAVWLPGETFADEAAGVRVRVEEATPTGYRVTLHTGSTLRVRIEGEGRVGSSPAGLSCVAGTAGTATCAHGFGVGAPITLGAVPALGWSFQGWGGSCAGSGGCTTVLAEDREVTARFDRLRFHIASDSLRPVASLTVPYTDTLRAEGAPPGVRAAWRLVSGSLPAGLTLDPGGVVGGTTGEAGRFRFVAAASAGGSEDLRPFTIGVEPALRITTDSLRATGVAGVAYADTLRADGSTPAYRWSLAEGSLPPGVQLDPATGALAGTPARAGRFEFVAAVTSATGVTARRPLSLRVTAPAIEPARLVDHLLGGAPLTADEVRYLDGIGNRNGRLDVGDVRAWLSENGAIDPARTPGLSEMVGAEVLPDGRDPRRQPQEQP